MVVQFLYAILLIVLVAEIVVVAADAVSAAQQLGGIGSATPDPTPAPSPAAGGSPAESDADEGVAATAWGVLQGVWDSLAGKVARAVAALGVLLWLVLPPKQKLKEGLINGATDYLAVDHYLRSGAGAPRLTGDINGLLDALRERKDRAYRRIDVCSYSLGSIVAFNSIFTFGSAPAPNSAIKRIGTMVTIGCPFDMVRLVRPDYFKSRQWLANPPKWLNVFAPADILGSNFRNDGDDAQASPEVMQRAMAPRPTGAPDPPSLPIPENLAFYPGNVPHGGLADSLVLSGFRVHGRYWDAAQTGEHSCFDVVAEHLYGDDPILQEES